MNYVESYNEVALKNDNANSGKVSDEVIRELCGEQYKVEILYDNGNHVKQGNTPLSPIYCSFVSVESYSTARGFMIPDKHCSRNIESNGKYHLSFQPLGFRSSKQ